MFLPTQRIPGFTKLVSYTGKLSISQMHHFYFSTSNPGIMYMKNSCNDTEKEMQLLKTPWQATLANMPNTIPPPGLTLEQ